MDTVRWADPTDREVPFDGAERRELAATDELALVHNALDAGVEYPAHTHGAVTQGVFMIEGAVEVFGDDPVDLGTGDSCVIPPGTRHGFRGVAPHSRLVVAFAPPVDVTPGDLDG